jgi:hypothetical protein
MVRLIPESFDLSRTESGGGIESSILVVMLVFLWRDCQPHIPPAPLHDATCIRSTLRTLRNSSGRLQAKEE